MTALKFCANISWLFTEHPDFSKRIYAAASVGFQAVEAAWLYDSDLSELQKAKEATRVEVVLINTPPGDIKAGDLGLGAVPGRELEFREGLDLTLKYAKALNCKRKQHQGPNRVQQLLLAPGVLFHRQFISLNPERRKAANGKVTSTTRMTSAKHSSEPACLHSSCS